jgi:hypothetical protein
MMWRRPAGPWRETLCFRHPRAYDQTRPGRIAILLKPVLEERE